MQSLFRALVLLARWRAWGERHGGWMRRRNDRRRAYKTADTLGISLNRVVNRGDRISNFVDQVRFFDQPHPAIERHEDSVHSQAGRILSGREGSH
ncbi:hypothetical protein [Methylobacterium frigidaeris]|uniref:Uncharacterized protein n=1 Tax=Methylobacterium frigidaeris TaxID=2038277 RepID=A0AA37M958_9HYPH|nr:hypothetical protein [Methylobacterium frigidaeris]GJD66821.1 hypothetical protein MPEAHAMD_7020 [Methylobacterium frigidaeris]